MKLAYAVLIACLTALLAQAQPVVPPDPERATLVIYREYSTNNHNVDFHLNLAIVVNGQKLCKLSDNRYLTYKLPPGPVTIQARHARMMPLEINLTRRKSKLYLQAEAGKVYYIHCDPYVPRSKSKLSLRPFNAEYARRTNIQPDNCQVRLHEAQAKAVQAKPAQARSTAQM